MNIINYDETLYTVLKNRVEPTATQKKGASRSHAALRELLCGGRFGGRIMSSYLTGSYARATAVRPLDDVDVVFIIDPSAWEIPWHSSFPDPVRVLDSFTSAIRRRYPRSSVHSQNRSVGLKLYDLDIDVIPAIDIGKGRIKIIDRRDETWIDSAPQFHSELAASTNDKLQGKFKPLVKLLKSWNNRLPETACLKSFLVETIATRLFQFIRCDSLTAGLHLYFDFLQSFTNQRTTFSWSTDCGIRFSRWFGIKVPDTGGTGSNVASRLNWARAERFLWYATLARKRLLEANAAKNPTTGATRLLSAIRLD